jgi:hypothetical protein
MKKLALMITKPWLSYSLLSVQGSAAIVLFLGAPEPLHAADFYCASGNVPCLIAAINDANAMAGQHVINLAPGIYTLQMVDNMTDGANGLPSIKRSIQIQSSADDPPTVIERDPGAQRFRIFHVSLGGELTLEGVTVQRGSEGIGGSAIFNRGMTSLRNTIVTDSIGEEGAIYNVGTLNVLTSIISDNFGEHQGGGIHNDVGGTALVENSSIAHNVSADGGGVFNRGSTVVRNSAIISNSTDCCQPGGGVLNVGGSVEIVNTTIAKNAAGDRGGGVSNIGGQVSITNSTIRENQMHPGGNSGSGIANVNGALRVQNTVVAGNTVSDMLATGPDCSGPITSLGNNLVGDESGCGINLQSSDLGGDPGLGELTGTGEEDLPGSAHYPVLAGSPVIGKGNPNACLQTDQLGNLRAGVCDIGAVEFRGPKLVSVDVRPKKDANRINPDSAKNINVAIFSVNG